MYHGTALQLVSVATLPRRARHQNADPAGRQTRRADQQNTITEKDFLLLSAGTKSANEQSLGSTGVVSRIFRTFDQATASVCMSCG